MPRNQRPLPKRNLRGGSDARQLVNAIVRAGVSRENIELTANSHLKVICPDGRPVIVGTNLNTAGAYAAARRDLAEHGVSIPARSGGGKRGNRQRQHGSGQPGDRQGGIISRYRPGDSYAFIDGYDGSTWYVCVPQLGPETARGLAYGCHVTFGGSPLPEAGKPYPVAADVRLSDGEPAAALLRAVIGEDTGFRRPPALPPLLEPGPSLPAEAVAALEALRGQLEEDA